MQDFIQTLTTQNMRVARGYTSYLHLPRKELLEHIADLVRYQNMLQDESSSEGSYLLDGQVLLVAGKCCSKSWLARQKFAEERHGDTVHRGNSGQW